MNAEQDLAQALQDIGVTREQFQSILNTLQAGDKKKAKNILLSVRSYFLSDLHSSQDRLYRLDYIIRNFK